MYVQGMAIAPYQMNVSVTQDMLDHIVKFLFVIACRPMTPVECAWEMAIALRGTDASVTQAMPDQYVRHQFVTISQPMTL